jgi:hypothetical protein
MLVRASKWFAQVLEQTCEEPRPTLAENVKEHTGYKFRFELVQCEESPGWVLKRSVSRLDSSCYVRYSHCSLTSTP